MRIGGVLPSAGSAAHRCRAASPPERKVVWWEDTSHTLRAWPFESLTMQLRPATLGWTRAASEGYSTPRPERRGMYRANRTSGARRVHNRTGYLGPAVICPWPPGFLKAG